MVDNKFSCPPTELKLALEERGLELRNWTMKEGRLSVIVPLIDQNNSVLNVSAEDPEVGSYVRNKVEEWGPSAFLYIITENAGGECRVGLVGSRGENQKRYRSDDWQQVSSAKEAIDAVMNIWNNRDAWMNAYVANA